MKELDLQTKAREAVEDMGGMAMKMSNRFLIGVPDLLVKLPPFPASFWEVKYRPVPIIRENTRVDATIQQKKWLKRFAGVGGLCGIISFIYDVNDMVVAIVPVGQFGDIASTWLIHRDEFVTLPRGSKMQSFKDKLTQVHERFYQ